MKSLPTGAPVLALLFLGIAHLIPLWAEDKSPGPLHSTVFLKPGEKQAITFSSPDAGIGARDRTWYEFEFVNDKGEKVSGLKGVKGEADSDLMGKLFDQHKIRFVVIRFSTESDAELGASLVRVQAKPFGGPINYETTVKIVVAK